MVIKIHFIMRFNTLKLCMDKLLFKKTKLNISLLNLKFFTLYCLQSLGFLPKTQFLFKTKENKVGGFGKAS